jgi:outer membrane protein TolC
MTVLSFRDDARTKQPVLWTARDVVQIRLSMTAHVSKLWVALCALSVCSMAGLAHAQHSQTDEAVTAQADVSVTAEPAEKPGPRRIELQAAIERALQRAVPIELARAEVLRAEGLLRQTRASWYPRLTGNAGYTRLDHERDNAGVRVAARDQLTADLRLSVPLIAAPSWVQTQRASDNLRISREEALEDRRQVATNVANTYLAVMARHRVIDVNERALKNAKAHYDYAHTRYQGGIGNELDDVRAAQDYESSVSLLEGSHAELVASQEALGVLLGEQGPLDVADTLQLTAAPSYEQALQDATTRRADVQANRLRQRSAQDAVDDSWADYMPFLSAEFRPFWTSPPSVTLPRTGWQALLVLSVPFYDGGARYGAYDVRKADLAASRTLLESVLRQAKSEVRVAFETAQRADASLKASTRAAELAGRAVQMAMQAYQAGATTDIVVLDAERRARDAETQAVIAEDTARRARVELLSASGRWP